jgi:carboxymethylenebutenolidase
MATTMTNATERAEVRGDVWVGGGPGFAGVPAGVRRGVVIIHEMLGRQPEIDRVVERFAQAGYGAVAPDLFSGGPQIVCLAKAIVESQRGEGPMIERLKAARAWLCERAGIDAANVGLIGFCFGGGFALAAGHGWGAVSTNYGQVPPVERLRGMGPTIGCYGARDRLFGKTAETLVERLRAVGTEVEAHTFEGVGHSFLTDGEHPVGAILTRPLFHIVYDPAVAEQGWSKILAFFDRHL